MSARYNLAIDQGATYSAQFTLLDAYGNALDLTAYTPASQLRVNYTDSLPAASFVCSVIAAGTVSIAMTPTTTAGLSAKAYVWDLTLTAGSDVIRPLTGKAVVSPEVTR